MNKRRRQPPRMIQAPEQHRRDLPPLPGRKLKEAGNSEAAEGLFDKADYWKRAISIAPNNYLEAQNWLKTTGRLHANF